MRQLVIPYIAYSCYAGSHEYTQHSQCRGHGARPQRGNRAVARVAVRPSPVRGSAGCPKAESARRRPTAGRRPRTVRYWVHRFAGYALAGLQEGARSGRPPRLDPTQVLQDQAPLRGRPADVGLGGNLWSDKDADRICAPTGGGVAPAPMPQLATAVGVPLLQATPGDRPRRIGATGRAENNYSGSLAKQRWISRRWIGTFPPGRLAGLPGGVARG